MSMRPLLVALGLALPACWSSSPPVQPAIAASSTGSAPEDATLERDLQRLGAFLADTGEPFTGVELVGFTATNGLVYRTTVCDPDELGGRGAYCSADVCLDEPGADPSCETLFDETVHDPSAPFDPGRVSAAIRAAETAKHPKTRGHTEAPTVVIVSTKDANLSVTAPTWFGPTRWTLLQGSTDPDSQERLGFTTAAITSVLSSDDGNCLAFAGTALRQARYESVVGSIRVAFAARRCRNR